MAPVPFFPHKGFPVGVLLTKNDILYMYRRRAECSHLLKFYNYVGAATGCSQLQPFNLRALSKLTHGAVPYGKPDSLPRYGLS